MERKMSTVLPLQIIWREEETGSWFWALTSTRRKTRAVPLYLSPGQDEGIDALQHISLCPVLLREIAVH